MKIKITLRERVMISDKMAGRKKHILIVDKDVISADVQVDVLRMAFPGKVYGIARNMKEGLEGVESGNYDVVLVSDLVLNLGGAGVKPPRAEFNGHGVPGCYEYAGGLEVVAQAREKGLSVVAKVPMPNAGKFAKTYEKISEMGGEALYLLCDPDEMIAAFQRVLR